MSKDIDILHHIGLISSNLDALASQFESLGFSLTPATLPRIQLKPGEPPEPIGVANRCAVFRDNYLEFLGVVDAARWATVTVGQRGAFDIDRPLKRYEGLHVLHFGAGDLDLVSTRLEAGGIGHLPIRRFERLVDTPTGMQMMRARSFSFPPGQMPEALFQVAQHETPELVLQPRYMGHANGAQAIVDVIVCVEDAEEAAARYAAVAGRDVQVEGRVRRIGLDRSDVLVTDASGLGDILPAQAPPTLPFLAGFTVSADIATSERFFERNGIPVDRMHGHLVVPRSHACGTSIRFRDAGAQ